MSYFDITSKSLAPNEKARTKTLKIGADILSIHANLKNINSGILKVYQSQNNKLFETDNDVFDVSGGKNHKQVPVKGRYAYIEFENGDETNEIMLSGKLSDENVSVGVTYQDCLMYARKDNGVVQNLKLDNDGKLLVNSSGGGSDISGSVSVSNFPETQNTHDVSAVELLSYIRDNVFSIDSNTTIIETQPVHLDLENDGPSVWADSTLPWIAPPNGEDGWCYINNPSGGAQLYYYANAPALNALSVEANITLGSVATGWFIGNQKLLTNSDNRFNVNIYTQPTGSGDAQPWYKSRRVYQALSDKPLSKGVDYFFYWGTDITLLHKELTHIELSLVIQEGTLGSNEIVEFMSINVPSNVTSNAFNGVVKRAGYVSSVATREVIFDSSVQKKAETQLAKLDVSGGELRVRDASVNEKLDQFSFLDDGYGNKELRVLVRNPSDIGVSVNNQVTVGLAEFSSVSLTAGSEVGLASGSQVSLVSGTEVALVSGTTVGVSGDVAITSATALSVTESNPITGFALETTQQDVYSRLHDVSGTVSISNFPALQDVSVQNSSLDVHCYGSTNGVSGNWHHLKTSNQGELQTHSQTRDGSGNSITSTAETGTVVYRGLDVVVKGSTNVVNTVGTQLAIKNTDDTAIITAGRNASSTKVADNQPSVNGPIQIGASVDTNGYMYVNAYISAGTVTTGGSVHLEFSPDGIVWGRAFYSAFFNTGTNQTALISVSYPLPWRYVRLYADSPIQLATVNAYISMK